jgi:hypothetical protein
MVILHNEVKNFFTAETLRTQRVNFNSIPERGMLLNVICDKTPCLFLPEGLG